MGHSCALSFSSDATCDVCLPDHLRCRGLLNLAMLRTASGRGSGGPWPWPKPLNLGQTAPPLYSRSGVVPNNSARAPANDILVNLLSFVRPKAAIFGLFQGTNTSAPLPTSPFVRMLRGAPLSSSNMGQFEKQRTGSNEQDQMAQPR